MAIIEAKVFFDKDDADPASSYIATMTQENAPAGLYIQAAEHDALDMALTNAGFGIQFAPMPKADTPYAEPTTPVMRSEPAPAPQAAAEQVRTEPAAVRADIEPVVVQQPEQEVVHHAEKAVPDTAPVEVSAEQPAEAVVEPAVETELPFVYDEPSAASYTKDMQEIGVLSVHPCDFLEMSSKSNTWVSCHRLSDGGYQAGCLSYMNDSASMVFYAVDADVSGEYRKAIRRYRQMFFYEDGTLFQSRLYPADIGNALEVSKLFRHLVQQAISRCLTEPNLWYLKTKRPDLNAHLSTYRGGLHYPDYNYHGNLSVLQGYRKDTELTIGAAAKCVCCGNELRSNGAIKCSCKEVAVCRKCGQTVARGQGIYLEDGFYCKTCLHICAACGRPSLGTMYPAYNRRGTLVEVCQNCYQQLTSGCASCSMVSACRAMGHTLCEKATVAVA